MSLRSKSGLTFSIWALFYLIKDTLTENVGGRYVVNCVFNISRVTQCSMNYTADVKFEIFSYLFPVTLWESNFVRIGISTTFFIELPRLELANVRHFFEIWYGIFSRWSSAVYRISQNVLHYTSSHIFRPKNAYSFDLHHTSNNRQNWAFQPFQSTEQCKLWVKKIFH